MKFSNQGKSLKAVIIWRNLNLFTHIHIHYKFKRRNNFSRMKKMATEKFQILQCMSKKVFSRFKKWRTKKLPSCAGSEQPSKSRQTRSLKPVIIWRNHYKFDRFFSLDWKKWRKKKLPGFAGSERPSESLPGLCPAQWGHWPLYSPLYF